VKNVISLYEKLGLFYLGKEIDPDTLEMTDNLLLYKRKYFTTHGVIIGMTGSGKTGLGIGIIEEAAIDGIPSIVIDPKGDMGNLLLAFPDLRPEDFEKWVDPDEAQSKGMDIKTYAEKIAKTWKDGIESFYQDRERIKRYRESADFTIYTPGSSAGIPLSVLDNFDAPSGDILEDPDTFSSIVNSTVSGLLALVGIKGDPITSKEHLLLANILTYFWKKGKTLSLEEIIGYVANPPFKKIGVLSLKTFYPQNERLKLAMVLNNILASPGFSAWIEGEPLNIQKLLYTDSGKPRVSIISIAHLSDSERMFFVTLFLNKFINWMRMQSGTSSLRTILYMDEIFGFFPATSSPPSKKPMLLLLKQARAFGIGVILATQNPVDLDYKGLSNIGSWFIGRLQTRQDKERLLDGLVKSSSTALGRKKISNLISNLKKRQFLLKSAYLDELPLFYTRWVLSYLRGPLSKQEIKLLMAEKRKKIPVKKVSVSKVTAGSFGEISTAPLISEKIKQYYLVNTPYGKEIVFKPNIVAKGRVRFYSESKGIDTEEEVSIKLPLKGDEKDINFKNAVINEDDFDMYDTRPPEEAKFSSLPPFLEELKNLKPVEKEFKDYLYRTRKLTLLKCKPLKLLSSPNEDITSFKMKVQDILREKKDKEIEKLEEKYREKEKKLRKKYDKLLQKLQKEKADVSAKTADSALSFGIGILGAILGGKSRTISSASRTATGIKSAGRILKEKQDVKNVEEEIKELTKEIEELQNELREKIEEIDKKYTLENYKIEETYIKPKKSDIGDIEVAILWEAD